MSEIETGLYLGGIEDALNARWVASLGLTHILTIDSVDLKRKYPDVQHKWIQSDDNETADLLSHFEICCRFIHQAIEGSVGRVLVHCQWGVSRSASVVCAYIMKKYAVALDEAISKVRTRRPQIFPNEGFRAQLSLFKTMGYQIRADNPLYRQFLAQKHQNAYKNQKQSVKARFSSEFEDYNAKPKPSRKVTANRIYRCKMCRVDLFNNQSVVRHSRGENVEVSWKVAAAELSEPERPCTEGHFIVPVKWMETSVEEPTGKISCPKCQCKLGSFKWSGIQCGCGGWITPGFHIPVSKVDECTDPNAK